MGKELKEILSADPKEEVCVFEQYFKNTMDQVW
jgi:hypothetical protein